MTPEDIQKAEQEISVSIEQAKEFLDRRDMLARLERNDDFKKLILELYLEKEPARLVGLLADPEMSDKDFEHINRDLMGISSFKQFLVNTYRLARQFEAMIERSEQELENLREGEE